VRKLALNSMVLAVGLYFASGASAFSYLLAARALAPTTFGFISGVIGIALVVAALADLGVNGWAIRALARRPPATDLFTRTLSAKVTLAALLAIVWVVISVAFPRDASLKLPATLVAGSLLCTVVAGHWPFHFAPRRTWNMVTHSYFPVGRCHLLTKRASPNTMRRE
jgi:O-antigen/teichoic acid export membrane protein